MNLIKKITLSIVFIFIVINTNKAQIESVNYQLRYNETSCLYDFYLIINEGKAVNTLFRAQFNSQISIVVPTGSPVQIVENYMPLQGNQNYNGNIPLKWYISSSIFSPEVMQENDFYSITPTLTPTSFYNNLNKGDAVRLFSLDVGELTNCGTGIRLFDNLNDPGSNAPGMGGGDFSNGFTIGGLAQRYNGNSITITPKKPKISLLEKVCSDGIEINLQTETSAPCHGNLTFLWTGPNNFTATSKNVNIYPVTIANEGDYTVKIKDHLGCEEIGLVSANLKPKSGEDQYVNCFSSGAATVSTAQSGSWSLSSNNSGSAVILSSNSKMATVSQFSQAGFYDVIQNQGFCIDTIRIFVGNNCNCSFSNILTIPQQEAICGETNQINIVGNEVSEAGTYSWLYKFNNQNFSPVSDASQNINRSNLQVGIHHFRRIFKSAQSCFDTSNVMSISVYEVISAGEDKVINCFETDTISLSATGKGLWTIGTNSAGTVKFSDVKKPNAHLSEFSNPGIYYFVWSNESCSDTTEVNVDSMCGCQMINGGGDRVGCVGDSLTIKGDCPNGTWRPLNGLPAGLAFANTSDGEAVLHFDENLSGTYSFVFDVYNQLFDTINISISKRPSITLGDDFDYCVGAANVILTAAGGKEYLWSTGETTYSILVSPDSTTTFTVKGTDQNGCSNSDDIRITVHPKPSGSIPIIAPVSEGETLQLQAGNWSNALIYRWSGPNNFKSLNKNPIITNVKSANAGIYYLTVISPFDCFVKTYVHVDVYSRALPVEITSFKARSSNNETELMWTTSSEINCEKYIVEKSNDGIRFSEIGSVRARNNENSESRYNFIDTEKKIQGNNYYRLRSVDFDQAFSITKIVSVEHSSLENLEASIYPNPAQGQAFLNIKASENEEMQIRLFDQYGNQIYNKFGAPKIENDTLSYEIDLSNMKKGIYFVTTISAGSRNKIRMVVL